MLEAQTIALSALRSAIEADARCLLPTPQFGQFVQEAVADRTLLIFLQGSTLRVTPDPTAWLLPTLPFPLQITHYTMLCDENAYNDETYYTDYRYELTTQLGSWQTTLEVSTASLSPGNPMRYQTNSLSEQHYDVTSRLLSRGYQLPNAAWQTDFPDLNLDEEQEVQLKQEMSYLIAFAGNLFNVRSRIEAFRYPQQSSR